MHLKTWSLELITIQNLKKLDEIRSRVLSEILPSDEENQTIQSIIKNTTDIIKKWNSSHQNYLYKFIQPHGSTGLKQTHLSGASDIDLFIFLDPDIYSEYAFAKKGKIKREKINELFRRFCTGWIIPALAEFDDFSDAILSYAEHPYISVKYKSFNIDIVFAFILSEDYILSNGPITPVDRTYFHTKFIRKHLNDYQRNDVRILKKFFKSHLSYGDKAPTGRGGFIGYAIELIIYFYSDIWTVFKNFKNLPNSTLDIYNRSETELRKSARLQKDFLLIMDPSDKKRNVAASISPRSWIYCSYVIEEFLNNPKSEAFLETDFPPVQNSSAKINEHFAIIEYNQINDDHYTKIRDKLYSMADTLKEIASYEIDHSIRFPGVNYSVYFDDRTKNYSVAFYTKKKEISERYLRKGPKAVQGNINFEKFKEKHGDNCVVKNNYSWVNQKRKYTNFIDLLKFETESRSIKEVSPAIFILPHQIILPESINALSVLKECILPYEKELEQIINRKIKGKKRR